MYSLQIELGFSSLIMGNSNHYHANKVSNALLARHDLLPENDALVTADKRKKRGFELQCL